MKSKITVDDLRADGWEINEGLVAHPVLAEKKIENRNLLNASEDSDIKLIVHCLYNSHAFAVLLPDGGMLNFVANSMQELHAFERAIHFYDPPF